jgi:beta-aspartyl-peptidase (threonine type)
MTVLVIHGGAGGDGPWKGLSDLDPERIQCMQKLLMAIGPRLEDGDITALEAVKLAVEWLEDEPLFNAGKGSVLDENKRVTMDASIMDGKDGRAGAVIGLQRTRNPVGVAHALLEQEWPLMFHGSAADDFAERNGCEMVDSDWLITELRSAQWEKWKRASLKPGTTDEDDMAALDHDLENEGYGTVGAVALDVHGNLASATSTGGMTGKPNGRVGDTPIIGAGTWADGQVAVSCTGVGEAFIRTCAAHTLSTNLHLLDMSLEDAATKIMHAVEPFGGRGGLIAVTKSGDFVLPYQTRLMYRGWYSAGQGKVAIGPEEYDIE